MIAMPRVSVKISPRSPIKPRDGMSNSKRTRPEPWFTILVILPLRKPIFSMMTPRFDSGQSITKISTGS